MSRNYHNNRCDGAQGAEVPLTMAKGLIWKPNPTDLAPVPAAFMPPPFSPWPAHAQHGTMGQVAFPSEGRVLPSRIPTGE